MLTFTLSFGTQDLESVICKLLMTPPLLFFDYVIFKQPIRIVHYMVIVNWVVTTTTMTLFYPLIDCWRCLKRNCQMCDWEWAEIWWEDSVLFTKMQDGERKQTLYSLYNPLVEDPSHLTRVHFIIINLEPVDSFTHLHLHLDHVPVCQLKSKWNTTTQRPVTFASN